jgi:hypothetical protein
MCNEHSSQARRQLATVRPRCQHRSHVTQFQLHFVSLVCYLNAQVGLENVEWLDDGGCATNMSSPKFFW